MVETIDPRHMPVYADNEDEKSALSDEDVSGALRQLHQGSVVLGGLVQHGITFVRAFRLEHRRDVAPSIRK